MKKAILVIAGLFATQTALAAVLNLGATKKTLGSGKYAFNVVSSATATGRHGTHTVKDLASGELQAKIGAWRKVAHAQVLVDNPSNIGGNVSKLIQVLKASKAAALRLKPSFGLPASWLNRGFKKLKEKQPSLNTRGELNKIINVLAAMGGKKVKGADFFYETRSQTLFFAVNGGTTHTVVTASGFFSNFVGLLGNKETAENLKIDFK